MIEQELAELKQRVRTLEERAGNAAKGNWRDAIGFAKDDALFSEAMRLGAEWRTRASKEGH